MGRRRQCCGGQAGVRAGLAGGAHQAAGCRARWLPPRSPTPKTTARARHPRTRSDPGADRARPGAELLVDPRPQCLSHRPPGRGHARAWSSASASSPIRQRCAPTATSSSTAFAPPPSTARRLKPPPKTDPIVAGWLDLGPVAVELARDPMRAAAALANWKRLYPAASGQRQRARARRQTQIAAATEFPDQIALLLPLSGRAEAIGVAVRDGFIAAYLQQGAAAPAAPEDLRRGRRDRRQAPTTTRSATAQVSWSVRSPRRTSRPSCRLSDGRTPVLALNFLGDSIERAAQLLSVRAAAGRRSAHGRAPRGRRWPAQRRRHRARRRMGHARRRGFRRRTEASRRHAARQRTLRPGAGGFLRRHQAASCRCATSRASRPPHRSDAAFIFVGGHRRRRAPDPAAAEVPLLPAMCRCTPPRTASSRTGGQHRYRGYDLSGHAVDGRLPIR